MYRKMLFKVLLGLKRNAKDRSVKRKRMTMAKWFLHEHLKVKSFKALQQRRLRN